MQKSTICQIFLLKSPCNLADNGYASHKEWKQEWQQARSDEIFTLGSKDETGGNQSCTPSLAEDGSISLRIRMPDSLSAEYGKYVVIPHIRFAYGHEVIVEALRNCQLRKELHVLGGLRYKDYGQAITFRFKKDLKGWRVFASTEIQAPLCTTHSVRGVISVDINKDHLAVVETDHFGNPIGQLNIPLHLDGLTKHQAQACIGDASAQIIALCEETKKPLIVEDLDFQKKRAQLREKHVSYARMLSSFAYQSILTHLKARGISKGVQVHSVNPAFTSLMGRVKFADLYGMTIHQAAALCIGRRFLKLSEKMPKGRQDIPDGREGHVTLDLPDRIRTKHVWHSWGQLNKKLKVALTAHFRTAKTRSSSSQRNSS